jgi:hypothetical protein
MGLFDWFRSSDRLQLESPDDDPDAKRLRLALRKCDFNTVAGFFRTFNDSDAREFYIRELTQWPGRPAFFDAWVQSLPTCAESWLLRGAHGIQWAWEARTGQRAENVAREQWPIFFERLEAAWADLERAIELNPTDASPYSERINCAIGLELEKKVVFDALDNARQRAVECWEPYVRTLFYLCKKWHGSHEEMFDFARKTSRAAQDGSGLHTLVAVAHIERWVYASAFDRNVELARKYWQNDDVREEVREAYRSSLGSPNYIPKRATRWQRSFFAFALTKAGAFKEAMVEFDRIGNRPPDCPWYLLGDPLQAFAKYRDVAKGNG